MSDAVRAATRADVPALVALMGEFYAEAGYPLSAETAARTFEGLLGDERLGGVWLADDGDDEGPAGFIALTVGFSMEYGGLRALFVETGADDPVARRVYERAGMEDTGRRLLAAPLAAPVHEA